MILKSIRVTNWRSLVGEVSLGPFSESLNVIHAPNGTGKSSVFEALRRGLFDAHHVTGGEIAAVQPWGRELTPAVTVEFIEAGETWRVEKSFLGGKSARLLRLEDGAFVPVADARNADDRIRDILAAEAPGRGLSKQEHWGLAQVLWAPQGELRLDSLSGTVSESLKTALGIQLSGESGGKIEDRIEARFLEFFTRKGSYKSGKHAAPILSLRERRDQLAEQRLDLREKHQAFEQAARGVEDARQRRLQARREAGAIRENEVKTQARVEDYTRLKAEQNNKRQAESLAREKHESLVSRQKQIQETRERIDTLKQSAASQEARLTELRGEESLAGEQLAARRTARETARARRGDIVERRKHIDAARDYLAHCDNAVEIGKRISQIDALAKQRAQARERRETLLAPASADIRKLRKQLDRRNQARAALKASQIHLAIRPENAIEVNNASDQSTTPVEAGETHEISGDDWVDVSIPGFGSVRASGPEGSADEHRAELEKALETIEKLCRPYGTEDPDKLQDVRGQADKLDREIQALEERIRDLLNEDTPDALRQQLAELRARITESEKEHPDWKEQPPVLSALQADFETFGKEINDAVTNAEDACEQAQARHTAAEKTLNHASAELKVTRGRLETATRQLDDLLADGLSDEARAKAISEALMTWQAARTAAEQAEAGLKAFPDDPAKELDMLRKQRTALEEAESRARDEEKTAEGQLQTLAAEGTYSRLVAVEEELAALESRIEEESIRMDAIRLLHETVTACKSRMLASVSAPVERSASRLFERIAGPRLGRLQLTGDWVPEAVLPETAADPVPLHNLSGGEQEQLYLVARLALAGVLAKDQRQLVVLDDVLNATDSGRLARLLTLLDEVSDRLQVIILTCHPERYRALDTATFFELKP